ncbi:MAG: MBL fold metallo-hydrolase [Oscillospiraceae bacterium]|nr:MBL fold metallo-hydrolase [Oscillospiraceae bacterium]
MHSNEISYTQLNIGCLSRNKFWGEPVDRACRAAQCTSTLLCLGDGTFLLVDPGLPYDQMKAALFNRRGIAPDKISSIFLTHFHGDHAVELERYERCHFFASKEEIALGVGSLPVALEPMDDRFAGIRLVPLPGHTMGTAGLAFVSGGRKILVAGDAVMTEDFFRACEGYFNVVDEEAAKQSIRYAGENFDIIVPGHDIQFPV